MGSAIVRPTNSFSAAMSFITRMTSSIFIPSGSVPTAAMISAGSSTSISKWITTFDAPHDFNQVLIASLFCATSLGVRCFIPYCFWRSLISSRSQLRNPTSNMFDGVNRVGNSARILVSPYPMQAVTAMA